MFSRRSFVLAAGFLALAFAVGCSGNKGGSFAQVSGVVTHNGNPVDGAKVTFYGTTEVDGKTSNYAALTDSQGKYVIASTGKDPGIPPGMYKVTVVKWEGGKGMSEAMDAGQYEAMLSDGTGATKGGPVNLLPKEYATVGSTKLSATLKAGENDKVDFALKGTAGK
jgi:hypothetical protein